MLSGLTALITGAGSGIGQACAKLFHDEGATVLLHGRSENSLQDTIKHIGSSDRVSIITADLEYAEQIKAMTDQIHSLDICIANAGLLGPIASIMDLQERDWDQTMAVNARANFLLLKALTPILKRSESPRIVGLTTGAPVVKGRAGWMIYGASKAAFESLMMSYADEVGDSSIRVNLLDPGVARTKMRAAARPDEDPMILPTPDIIAAKVLHLAAPDCSWHGEIVNA